MKELSDEDIQELLAAGSRIDLTHDVQLYEAIFKELHVGPTVHINGLSSEVIRAVQYRIEWQNRIKFWAISSVILISGSAAFIFIAGSVDSGLIKQILILLYSYKWVCLFVIMIFSGAEIVDRALLSNRQKIAGAK